MNVKTLMTDKEKLRALLMTIMLGDYGDLGSAFDVAGTGQPEPLFDDWLGPRFDGYIDSTGYFWKPSKKGLEFLSED